MKYVIADIHGNERRFNSIMKQINLQREDTLYVLGDVIDRHPGGIRILRRIISMPNAKMLLGNHEYMMLRALGYPYDPYDPKKLSTDELKTLRDKFQEVLLSPNSDQESKIDSIKWIDVIDKIIRARDPVDMKNYVFPKGGEHGTNLWKPD